MTVCERIQRQLAVSNREWSAIEREQVETHLQSCAQCAIIADQWAAQARLLAALPRHSMSPERQRGLIARTHREGKGLRMHSRLAQGLTTAAGMLVLALVTASMAVLFRYLASWQGEAMTFTPAQRHIFGRRGRESRGCFTKRWAGDVVGPWRWVTPLHARAARRTGL